MSEKLKNAPNEYVWKKYYYSSISPCNLCSPNKGCNRNRRWKVIRTWKKHRKSQWK